MQRFLAVCASFLLFAFGMALQVQAGVPLVVHHQGRLLDDLGAPVDGVVPIKFELFDAESDGVSIWVEFHVAVPVTGGLFNVELGSLAPLSSDLFSPPGSSGVEVSRYLEVTVNGTELTPRLRIESVPYALGSQRVSGDIETSPGEVSLSGLGGSTTATIRSSQNPGSSGSEIVLMDGGGSTTGTIRAGVDSSGYSFGSAMGPTASTWTSAMTAIVSVSNAAGTKGIATGVSPGSSHITMTDGGLVAASLESNDDTTKLLLSKSGPQIKREYIVQMNESNLEFRMSSDADGDETDEQSLSSEISSVVGTTLDLVSDTDDDGVPNSFVQHSSKESSGGIRLGGMSGSTTGTIRMMASPDSVVDVLDSDDDGDGFSEGRVVVRVSPQDGSDVGAASLELSTDRAAAGPRQSVSLDGSFSQARTMCISDLDRDGIDDVVVVSSSSSTGGVTQWYVDRDDDGFGDNSMEAKVTPTTCSHAINTKGTGAQNGRVFGSESRSQDDGVVRTFVWRQTEGPLGVLEIDREVAMEVDTAGSALSISNADGSRGQISAVSGMSGSTTGTIRMSASPDSVDISAGVDTDGDGHRAYWTQNVSRAANAKYELAGDLDDDGLEDHYMESEVDASQCRTTWKSGMSGSTTGTIRMAASPDSVTDYRDVDSDDDGVPDASSKTKVSGSSATSSLAGMSGSTTGTIRMTADGSGGGGGGGSLGDVSSLILEADLDGDAVVDHSISSDIDGDGPSLTVSNAAGTRGQVTAKSGMSGSTTGTIRMTATADSAEAATSTDSDGDGVDEVTISTKTKSDGGVFTMHGSTTGTIRMGVSNSGLEAALTIGDVTTSHFIDVEGGAYCDGTNWVNASDAASKENFKRVDGAKLLDQIADLEITRWNYKGQDGVEHIGPTAQDFQKAFGVGSDNKSISTIDPSGIALAAIKELQKQNRDLAGENRELRERLERLARQVEALVATR